MFVVSLIGRPNVGKSSLFNNIVKNKKGVMTYNRPGVTRDNHYGLISMLDKQAVLIDTGGFYSQIIDDGDIFNLMRKHGLQTIDQSDLVLVVVDIREGLLPEDKAIVNYVRSRKKKFFLIINKFDTEKQRGDELQFLSLGIDLKNCFLTSSSHNLGIINLIKDIDKLLDNINQKNKIDFSNHLAISSDNCASLAIVGLPNSGKSTLLNTLLKDNRSLVSNIPGTTIDPVESLYSINYKNKIHSFKIVDTAGIRKKSNIADPLEKQAVFRSIYCISKADIIIYMIDAHKGLTRQDSRLLNLAFSKGKSLIICINKMDQFSSKWNSSNLSKIIKNELPWANFCQTISMSALKARGIEELESAILKTLNIRKNYISTKKLNEVLKKLSKDHTISLKGKRAEFSVKYSLMVKSDPPTFVIFSNTYQRIPRSYERFLITGLRREFKLDNTPVKLIFRKS